MAKARSSSSAPGDAGGNAIVPIERNDELVGIGSPGPLLSRVRSPVIGPMPAVWYECMIYVRPFSVMYSKLPF